MAACLTQARQTQRTWAQASTSADKFQSRFLALFLIDDLNGLDIEQSGVDGRMLI